MMNRFLGRRRCFVIAITLLLAGCSVGPKYHRPEVETPVAWRCEQNVTGDAAQNGLPSTFWEIFKDSGLDRLEAMALEESHIIKKAIAHVDEARAAARLSRSAFYPQITAGASYSRQNTPSDVFIPGVPIGADVPHIRDPYNMFGFSLDLEYEADVWGRVRRSNSGRIAVE